MEEVEFEGESGVAASDGASLTTYLHRTLEVELSLKRKMELNNRIFFKKRPPKKYNKKMLFRKENAFSITLVIEQCSLL